MVASTASWMFTRISTRVVFSFLQFGMHQNGSLYQHFELAKQENKQCPGGALVKILIGMLVSFFWG